MRFLPHLVLAATLTLAACAADESGSTGASDPDEAQEAIASREADLRENCKNPRRYDARANSEACTDIPAVRGVWKAKRLAPDAPDGLCTYDFRRTDGSTNAPTKGDRDALTSMALVAPNCAHRAPSPASLEPIPAFIDPSHGGGRGCDVCGGKGLQRKAWILLPPDAVTERRIEVRLVSGETRAFALQNVPNGASAVRVELPLPPAGDAWVQGSISAR